MQKTLFSKHFITVAAIILLSITILGAVLLAFATQYFKHQPTLYRKVKQKTGLSIIEVIHGVRMSKAASIIMSGRYSSLTEVAEMVGYDSMISFRKQFVAQFGVLPSKYMEEKMRK